MARRRALEAVDAGLATAKQRIDALAKRCSGAADPEVRRRVDAILPFLMDEVEAAKRGEAPSHAHRGKVIRNVAFHVFNLPMDQLEVLSF